MANENVFLLHALIMGIFITFIYDILRIFRRVVPHSRFWVSMEDISFWVYCAAKVFFLMHNESNGTLRWFAVLGACVGMFAYKKLISSFFVKYVSRGLQKSFGFLFKPFITIGKKAAGRLKKMIKKLWKFLKKKLTFLIKMLKMNLY